MRKQHSWGREKGTYREGIDFFFVEGVTIVAMSHEKKLTVLTRNQPRNYNQGMQRSGTLQRTKYKRDKNKQIIIRGFGILKLEILKLVMQGKGIGSKNNKKAIMPAN